MWHTNAYSDSDTNTDCYGHRNTDGNSNNDPNAYTKQHTEAYSNTQASTDSRATPVRRNPFTEEQTRDRLLKLPELLRSRFDW